MPLIAVCPRSGTNYWTYFLGIYHLAQREELDVVDARVVEHIRYYDYDLGSGPFPVGHAFCPGFESVYHGPKRQAWDAIPYDPSWDVMRAWIEKEPLGTNPVVSPTARIVYQYRNPLDQMISHHAHEQGHRNEGPFTGKTFAESLWARLDKYIRLHFTYTVMKELYPDCIMMLPYEIVMQAPERSLRAALRHLGHEVTPGTREQAFQRALQLTTPQKMREIELRLGQTLAADQAGDVKTNSHMRGGKVGKWTDQFDHDTLEKIRDRLRSFDIELDDFILTAVQPKSGAHRRLIAATRAYLGW